MRMKLYIEHKPSCNWGPPMLSTTVLGNEVRGQTVPAADRSTKSDNNCAKFGVK